MLNKIDSKNTSKTYNAGDLADAYNLAFESMDWMETLICQIMDESKKIKSDLEAKGQHVANFHQLDKLLGLTHYLAMERGGCFDLEHEKYGLEHEQNKRHTQNTIREKA